MITDFHGALLAAADALRSNSLIEEIPHTTTGIAIGLVQEAAASGKLPATAQLQLCIFEQRIQAAQEALNALQAFLPQLAEGQEPPETY